MNDASGPGKTVPIDAYDIARVAAHVLTKDGHVGKGCILNGPEALTAREQVEILADVLGRQIGCWRRCGTGRLTPRQGKEPEGRSQWR